MFIGGEKINFILCHIDWIGFIAYYVLSLRNIGFPSPHVACTASWRRAVIVNRMTINYNQTRSTKVSHTSSQIHQIRKPQRPIISSPGHTAPRQTFPKKCTKKELESSSSRRNRQRSLPRSPKLREKKIKTNPARSKSGDFPSTIIYPISETRGAGRWENRARCMQQGAGVRISGIKLRAQRGRKQRLGDPTPGGGASDGAAWVGFRTFTCCPEAHKALPLGFRERREEEFAESQREGRTSRLSFYVDASSSLFWRLMDCALEPRRYFTMGRRLGSLNLSVNVSSGSSSAESLQLKFCIVEDL